MSLYCKAMLAAAGFCQRRKWYALDDWFLERVFSVARRDFNKRMFGKGAK